jgi:excisionase family DNA binding protein
MATRNPQRNQSTKAAKKVSTARADSERRTLSVEEAGRVLGISRQAAYTYANAGTIPVIRLGKRMLVPKAALEKLLGGSATAD